MPNLTRLSQHSQIQGPYAQILFELLRKGGISNEIIAEASGVEVSRFFPIPDYVSGSDYCRIMEAGARLTNNPLFGLQVGFSLFAASHGTYGMILMTAQTIGEALKQVVRYEGLLHNLGKTEIHLDGEEFEISWTSPWPEVNSSQSFPVKEIGFRRPTPDHAELYQSQFRCAVKFGQNRLYGRASAEILSWPLPYAVSNMKPVLISHAEELLSERQKSSEVTVLENAVKEAIMKQLSVGNSGVAEVAAALNISVRTLQRRLQVIDIPFRLLLDNTRRELAQRYLRTTTLTLTEIAFLVGYQEQSSFNHAFREWTNTTPSLWRAANARGVPLE
jgi:AraC-like DNA-binding protein